MYVCGVCVCAHTTHTHTRENLSFSPQGDDDAYLCVNEDHRININTAFLRGRSSPVLDSEVWCKSSGVTFPCIVLNLLITSLFYTITLSKSNQIVVTSKGRKCQETFLSSPHYMTFKMMPFLLQKGSRDVCMRPDIGFQVTSLLEFAW